MSHDPDPNVQVELAAYLAKMKSDPEEEIDVGQYIRDEDEEIMRRVWQAKQARRA
jgi:hypothetical protein